MPLYLGTRLGSYDVSAIVWALTASAVLADGQVDRVGSAPNPNLVIAANLVYSPADRKVLMVNGAVDLNTNALARVWSWDGRAWSAQSDEGPVVRVVGGAAYDVRRERLVLFGGARPGGGLDDMWAWDGASWRRQPDASVGPRDHHVMAYDARRDRVVLFGGSGARPPGADRRLSPTDTWEWNGERWRKVSDTGPAPRYAHAMAYDTDRGVVVLYGGSTFRPVQYFTDMWEWNGERWTEIKMSSPNPGVRYSPGLAYDQYRRRMVLYGGVSVRDNREPQYVFDTWEWDGKQWTDVR